MSKKYKRVCCAINEEERIRFEKAYGDDTLCITVENLQEMLETLPSEEIKKIIMQEYVLNQNEESLETQPSHQKTIK